MLPSMDTKPMMRPTVRTQFRGLNNNLSAQDGEIVWMENMSSREYPLLANRKRRILFESLNDPRALGSWDDLYWIDGVSFFYDLVKRGELSEGYPDQGYSIAAMNRMIFIFPDKKYYDIDSQTFGNMGVATTLAGGVSFMNGTYAEVPADANTIYKAGAAWTFQPGDGITIAGCTVHPENNKSVIVREVDGDYLRFYEGTFTLDSTYRYTAGEEGLAAGTYYFIIGRPTDPAYHFTLSEDMAEGDTLTWNGTGIDAVIGGVSSTIAVTSGQDGSYIEFADIPTNYSETADIVITRDVPDMDYVCVNENRLWGCKGDMIYASALGDPFNFNVFDGLSTDSWQSSVSDEGDFTACVSYGGYPIFFKEHSICKVQGDKPSNFQWTLSNRFGVKSYCHLSLAVAGETLFYLSPAGVCAYNGGAPTVISERLGANTVWTFCTGGSDGIRYYAALRDQDENDSVYVYDTRYGEWFREDGSVGWFTYNGGYLYQLTIDGSLWKIGKADDNDELEDKVKWQVKFADSDNFYETTDSNSQNKKGPLRILIRATLEKNTEVVVKIKYDDGTTHTVGTITGSSSAKKKTYIIPLILRRCDHYRLSLDGVGDAVIYSISMERYSGSQYQGSSNVTLPNAN